MNASSRVQTADSASAATTPEERTDFGKKPNMCWLPKASLRIDKRYQRELRSSASAKLIAQLVANFCWMHCAPLVVTENGDNTYNVIDGQHRMAAAMKLKAIKLLPCYVVDEMTLREQAESFVAHNSMRVRVGALAIFHAQAVAGDLIACGVLKACRDAGVVIPRGHRKAVECKPNETSAIGILAEIYRSYDTEIASEILANTLKVIVAAYPEKPGQISSLMVRSVWKALEDHPDETVTAALRATCDADLNLEARFAIASDNKLKTRDAYLAALKAQIAKVPA